MMHANSLKLVGCAAMAIGVEPMLAFGLIGLGAAAYSPAKYGLVTELVTPRQLVAANGWIEVSTVCAVIFGTVLGGALVSATPWPIAGSLREAMALVADWVPGPLARTSRLLPGLLMVLGLYAAAAMLNAGIPDSGARYPKAGNIKRMWRQFFRANATLWRDPQARVSLAMTTLFWGVGASLQFLVLRWAQAGLGLALDQAAYLQGVTALGVVIGAALAGRFVALNRAENVLPLGVAIGLVVPVMAYVDGIVGAVTVLVVLGAMTGFFVVPMNALLQHRGHRLLSAGRSIAVQNFNENLSVLMVVGLYSVLLAGELPVGRLIWAYGLVITGIAGVIVFSHRRWSGGDGVVAPGNPVGGDSG
jgi:hypothetical protein